MSSTRPNLSFVYKLRTASAARGASFAPHFGQRSRWHARQKARLQVTHKASGSKTTGHLAVCSCWPQFPFAAVVVGWCVGMV